MTISGYGSVWLERTAGGREVAGSNPVTPIFLLKSGIFVILTRSYTCCHKSNDISTLAVSVFISLFFVIGCAMVIILCRLKVDRAIEGGQDIKQLCNSKTEVLIKNNQGSCSCFIYYFCSNTGFPTK